MVEAGPAPRVHATTALTHIPGMDAGLLLLLLYRLLPLPLGLALITRLLLLLLLM